MSTVEKVSVALTADMAAMVRKAVASGAYASGSEVIREALRDWQTKQMIRERQIEDIRRLWQEGIESGPARYEDVEDFLKEARRRYKARPEPSDKSS